MDQDLMVNQPVVIDNGTGELKSIKSYIDFLDDLLIVFLNYKLIRYHQGGLRRWTDS